MANSAEEICNLALSRIGSKNTIESIDEPNTAEERVFALWYDPCRQIALKKLAPNCALARKIIAVSSYTPEFGWSYAYEYPNDCLKVLGIGEVEEKENDYSVESDRSTGKVYIFTDEEYSDGMNLRYVKDLTDVSKFSIELILAIVSELTDKIAITLTQDKETLKLANQLLSKDQNTASALNAQENRPVRINTSKFKQARHYTNPRTSTKL